eukprot:augustus_masked-scaffold_31-processed-gene-2.60-mRNA-1 protein AED:0.99 eAED:1.00 QI:0/-1/0/1/-1/1/1/0/510
MKDRAQDEDNKMIKEESTRDRETANQQAEAFSIIKQGYKNTFFKLGKEYKALKSKIDTSVERSRKAKEETPSTNETLKESTKAIPGDSAPSSSDEYLKAELGMLKSKLRQQTEEFQTKETNWKKMVEELLLEKERIKKSLNISEYEFKIADLKRENQNLKLLNEELVKKEEKNKNTLEQLLLENQRLKQNEIDLNARCTEYESKLIDSEKSVETLRTEQSQLMSKLNTVESEVEDFGKIRADLISKHSKEVSLIKNELDDKDYKLLLKNNECETLQSNCLALEKVLGNEKEKYEHKILTLENSHREENEKHNTEIEELIAQHEAFRQNADEELKNLKNMMKKKIDDNEIQNLRSEINQHKRINTALLLEQRKRIRSHQLLEVKASELENKNKKNLETLKLLGNEVAIIISEIEHNSLKIEAMAAQYQKKGLIFSTVEFPLENKSLSEEEKVKQKTSSLQQVVHNLADSVKTLQGVSRRRNIQQSPASFTLPSLEDCFKKTFQPEEKVNLI